MIDFSQLGQKKETKLLSPRDIFGTLTEKNQKYEYLRDVQSEVMAEWFDKRSEKDSIIKMNTGSGKTVVGLLILKSCLSENKGPAVYVAPDPYLVKQVLKEATELGIEATGDEKSARFTSGKAILVINIHKLINGRSTFGVETAKINIGSIIIDDAHASTDYAEDQFTLTIPKGKETYESIYALFKNDLKEQCEMKVLEMDNGEYNSYMQVPFWAWRDKIVEISKILLKAKDDEQNSFKWPLIKKNLKLCNCIIGSNNIEISPKFLMMDIIPSLHYAKRRIFMTATLSDDTLLSTHFSVDIEKIEKIISPIKSNDIGERMILAPQELNPEITDDEIKNYMMELAKKYNVVIIVPSSQRSKFWKDITHQTLTTENLEDGINNLKEKHVGITVIVNKYDGIDLPKNACHVLVIDGLPDVRRQIDKIKESALQGSNDIQNQLIHKIEQGMGRGIRSSNDYCCVVLLGKKLIGTLYSVGAIDKFSSATKLQMDLSEQISEQIRGRGLDEIKEVFNLCLLRDKQWMQASKNSLIEVEYKKEPQIKDEILAELKAFNFYKQNNLEKTIDTMNEIINKTNNDFLKGWLMQELAYYLNTSNPIEAQKTLMAAQKFNSQLIKPKEGIQYDKLNNKDYSQAQQVLEKITNSNEFILKVDKILEDIVFKPNTSNRFEQAIKDIGEIIGFKCQRPENEYNKGPDVLIGIGDLEFLVIECKNESIGNPINKHDCNQLNGSKDWFLNNYDSTCCKGTPIMIHKSYIFEYACSPNKDIRIMGEKEIVKLKKNIKDFSRAVTEIETKTNVKKIEELLQYYKISKNHILKEYTEKFKEKKQ